MAEEGPSKNDISAVFKKLRSAPSNKVCFDCGAKNPTWSSVTYGVFICIDCSAIHRGLGVHVSFVRSTQLDTNWTWLQLRAMQVGGNANATQFFRQHSCTTTDAQQKYKSRAAQLYKEKLHQQAVAAMRLHGYKLHLDQLHGDQMSPHSPADKEIDFFDEHTKRRPSGGEMIRNQSNTSMSDDAFITASHGHPDTVSANVNDSEEGPKVDDNIYHNVDGEKPTTKSVIGQRKPTTGKKAQSAGKKGGLGAQKVDANFSRIEKEAESIERANLQSTILSNNLEKDTKNVEEVTGLSARLMVRDIGDNVKKRDEQLKQLDPKKYEQADRLGMGTKVCKSGVSHSVFADMKTIQQEGEKTVSNFDSPLLKSRKKDEDDWEVLNMEPVSKTSSYDTRKRNDEFFDSFTDAPSTKPKDSWLNTGSNNNNNEKYNRSKGNTVVSASSSDEATKKFGNAKAISSDQFFDDKSSDFETRSNFARFEGQSAISSADFFGGVDSSKASGGSSSSRNYGGGYGMAAPDIADIKDSVRQGVTKVAGKLSALSSSVSNYMGNYS